MPRARHLRAVGRACCGVKVIVEDMVHPEADASGIGALAGLPQRVQVLFPP